MGRGIGSYIRKNDECFVKAFKKCMYCGSINDLCIDHIHPLNKGGNSERKNLTLACNKCNCLKLDFDIHTFYERILLKRIDAYTRVYGYSGRLRTERKRMAGSSLEKWLTEKIIIYKTDHSYFTKIINSLIFKRYVLHG